MNQHVQLCIVHDELALSQKQNDWVSPGMTTPATPKNTFIVLTVHCQHLSQLIWPSTDYA